MCLGVKRKGMKLIMKNNQIIDFIKKHKDFYPEYFKNNRLSKIRYGYTCDINQIYCYLDKIPIRETDYFLFSNIISKHFNLKNIEILEIACGYIPILSGIFKDNYNSNITAVNNKILIENYKGVTTKEFDLMQPYDFSSSDLIIGFRPCEITENVILQCFNYKKSFVIYLCPCTNKPLNESNYDKKNWTYQKWHKYIIKMIKNNNEYKCKVIYKHKLEDECPIIIAKYKG